MSYDPIVYAIVEFALFPFRASSYLSMCEEAEQICDRNKIQSFALNCFALGLNLMVLVAARPILASGVGFISHLSLCEHLFLTVELLQISFPLSPSSLSLSVPLIYCNLERTSHPRPLVHRVIFLSVRLSVSGTQAARLSTAVTAHPPWARWA